MADIDKLNIDSIIQRLLEGKLTYVSLNFLTSWLKSIISIWVVYALLCWVIVEMVGPRFG